MILNDSHLKTGFSSLPELISKFQSYEWSSMKFLMICNLLGNRSYNDLTQYHVFPWMISNYNSVKVDMNNDSAFRNLELPMGMIVHNNSDRKDSFMKEYKLMQSEYTGTRANDETELNNNETHTQRKHIKCMTANERELYYENYNNVPYHYGTNYSNPLYVSHYLIRLFPYTQLRIECQSNNFDSSQLFNSMSRAYHSATINTKDVRELIREFYILPEMLLIIHELTLGLSVLTQMRMMSSYQYGQRVKRMKL